MFDLIMALVIGIILIFIGILNTKGNVSMLHSYHRHRVSEKDMIPFGKMVGLGTIIIGCSIILYDALFAITFFADAKTYEIIGYVILVIGLVVGLIISFYAMIKYNNGIF